MFNKSHGQHGQHGQPYGQGGQKAQKPTFNVNPPFMGVLMVQLNHAMSIELQRFISSIDDVEDEIQALKSALRDPANSGVYVYKDGPSFLVIRSFKGVVMIEMNQEMRELLISFISDIEGGVDKIIWAFRLALENPAGREARSRPNAPDVNKRRRIRGAYAGANGNAVNNGGDGDDDEYEDDDEEYDDEEGEFEDEEGEFEDEEVRDEAQPAK